jgi:hypothetical protein
MNAKINGSTRNTLFTYGIVNSRLFKSSILNVNFIVLWVINPLSTQLKGYQPKIKQPGCLSRLITPWVNNPNKRPGLLKIRVTTQKPKNL